MVESAPFHHEWTISGLNSVCDRITEHPHIKSIIDERFEFRFYPAGYDEFCRKYVSLGVFKCHFKEYHFIIKCKISIKNNNNKNENLFVKEILIKGDKEFISRYIKLDNLLDLANGLTHNDQFTLCFEGWLHKSEEFIIQTNLENYYPLSRDYFDFSPLLSTKSLTIKWTIENVRDLFESNKSSIELPEFKDSTETETEEAIFSPQIEIIQKSDSNNRELMFNLKSYYKGLIVIETSVIDSNQQRIHSHKKALESFINGFIYDFDIEKKIYSSESTLTDNRLTLFCEITRITEPIKKENKFNYLEIFEYLEVPRSFEIIEWTIDGKTGENLQYKIVPSLSNIANKETELKKLEIENSINDEISVIDHAATVPSLPSKDIEIEKLVQLSNSISTQTETIDHATITVNNLYHEHYFENANINNSLLNTKSKSIFGDIFFKSETTSDCTELIVKLENVVSSSIELVLDQNEQMCTELKSSNEELLAKVLTNQQEMKTELNELHRKFTQMKQAKKVKQSKIKKIVDKIIELLNRIKFELNKVGTKVKIKVEQAQQSKPSEHESPEPTLTKFNLINDHIELYTSPLIKFVQNVPTSVSISDKIKESHIHKLKTVKTFLITHLPAKNCLAANQNFHFEIDSITKENAEHKLADIIGSHSCHWDKNLLTKLRDLIVELKSESITILSDAIHEDTESSE